MAIGTAAGGAPNKVAEATLAAAALVGLTCGPAIFVCMWSRRLQRQRREQLLRAFHEPETVAGHGRPATGRDLAQALPVEQVAELQTGQTCTICLETFARGHSVQTMPSSTASTPSASRGGWRRAPSAQSASTGPRSSIEAFRADGDASLPPDACRVEVAKARRIFCPPASTKRRSSPWS
eukprot:CAMPEP_0176117850 /NCGR_PEP_ID=MMETSP0120_2-20121206/59213_1 /TAXON_ID=160619 /ORGANISM="Kryptoperidinium foliaceum, Strain CCMP 1326" /LENGTH=179 /DNA_ID=CAMNT_0017452159 /DNA_START=191 /DNA_END=731 /DNA_ORIENTATION=-